MLENLGKDQGQTVVKKLDLGMGRAQGESKVPRTGTHVPEDGKNKF